MTKLDFLLNGQLVDFDINANLLNKLGGLGDGVAVIRALIEGTPLTEEQKTDVQNALAGLGIDIEGIEQKLTEAFSVFGGSAPENLDLLARRIEDVEGVDTLSWKIFSVEGAGGGDGGVSSLNYKAEASGSLEIFAGFPAAAAEVGVERYANCVGLSLELEGEAGTDVGLEMSPVTFQSSAGASFSKAYEYYFEGPPMARVGAVLAEGLKQVPAADNLAVLRSHDTFRAFRTRKSGSFNFSTKLSAALDGSLFGAPLTLGLSAGGSVSDKSSYDIIVNHNPETHVVRVDFDRQRTKENESEVGISLSVDLASFAGKASDLIKHVNGELKGVLDVFDDLVKPGDWLQEQVKAALDDNLLGISNDLNAILASALGLPGSSETAIKDALMPKIEGRLLTYRKVLENAALGKADDLMEDIVAALPYGTQINTELKTKLEDTVKDVLTAMQGKLTELVSEVPNLADAQKAALAAALGKGVEELNDAAAVIKPVRKKLASYYKKLGKFAEELDAEANTKLKIAWGKKTAEKRENIADLSFVFSPSAGPNDMQNTAFEQLLEGNLIPAQKLAADPATGVTVTGHMKEMLEQSETESFALNFLMFSFLSEETVTSVLELEDHGGDGILDEFSVLTRVSPKVTAMNKESREAVVALKLHKKAGEASSGLFEFNFHNRDNELSIGEATDLFAAFNETLSTTLDLTDIGDPAATNAQTPAGWFASALPQGDDEAEDTVQHCRVYIAGDAYKQLLDGVKAVASDGSAYDTFRSQLANDIDTFYYPYIRREKKKRVDRFIQTHSANMGGTSSLSDLLVRPLGSVRAYLKSIDKDQIGTQQPSDDWKAAQSLLRLTANIQDLDAAMDAIAGLEGLDPTELNMEALDDAIAPIEEALAGWMKINHAVIKNLRRPHPSMLILVRAFARLAAVNLADVTEITGSHENAEGRMVVSALWPR